MATKDDVQMIIGRIDGIIGELRDYSRKAIVHDYRLMSWNPKSRITKNA
jgi:hypothetical protein